MLACLLPNSAVRATAVCMRAHCSPRIVRMQQKQKLAIASKAKAVNNGICRLAGEEGGGSEVAMER